jgi:hypothetical protein
LARSSLFAAFLFRILFWCDSIRLTFCPSAVVGDMIFAENLQHVLERCKLLLRYMALFAGAGWRWVRGGKLCRVGAVFILTQSASSFF